MSAAELHQIVAALRLHFGCYGRRKLPRQRLLAKLAHISHEGAPSGLPEQKLKRQSRLLFAYLIERITDMDQYEVVLFDIIHKRQGYLLADTVEFDQRHIPSLIDGYHHAPEGLGT